MRAHLPSPLAGYGVHGSDSLVDGKMIHSLAADLQGQWMAFGDIRVEDRCEWVLGRIVATGSLHPRRIGGTRGGGNAVHRFLSSPSAFVGEILTTAAARPAARCAGPDILGVQDST